MVEVDAPQRFGYRARVRFASFPRRLVLATVLACLALAGGGFALGRSMTGVAGPVSAVPVEAAPAAPSDPIVIPERPEIPDA